MIGPRLDPNNEYQWQPIDPMKLRRDAILDQLAPNAPPIKPPSGQQRDVFATPADDRATTQPVTGPKDTSLRDGTPGPAISGTGGGGRWNANYEWEAGEGGPKVSDLLSRIGDPSRLTGFNTAGWGSGERGTESSKNTFGMLASRIDPTQANAIDQLMAMDEFRAFYPNAQKVGRDQIDFDGPGPDPAVDVLRNFGAAQGGGGDAWAYQPVGGAGGAGGSQLGSGSAGPALPSGVDDLANSDVLAQILRQISGLTQGENPLQRDLIMQLLGGQA